MASSLRLAGVAALASASLGLAAIAACSDDEKAEPSVTADGGGDAQVVGADTGVPGNPCATAQKPARTKTAKQCTAELGQDAVVVGGACVPIKSRECQTAIGPWDNDDAILLGQLTNTHGVEAISGKARIDSIELGLNEINREVGGIPTADGCFQRPLAVIVCDDSNALIDPAAGADGGSYDRRAAARHLAQDLKVAAILGPHISAATIDVANNVTVAAKTLIMAPTAGAADITTLDASVDGTRLVWRTVPSDALQSKAVRRVGEKAEAEIKAANPGKVLNVAIVNRGDAFGRGLRDGVKQFATHNGKSWAANDAANILEIEYATSAAPPATIKDELIAFKPDIIYFFGLGEIHAPVLGGYETAREADPTNTTRPIWVTSASGQRAELLTQIAAHPDVRLRARGTSSVLLNPLTNNFYTRFKAGVDGGANQPLIFGMAQSYDSIYSIAYAVGATPGLDLTKQVASIDVAKGIAAQVQPGATEISVGPDKVRDGLDTVRKGQKINFRGATGPLDFDLAVGEAPGDYAVWCVRIGSASAPIFENATGESWNFQTDAIEGTSSGCN